MLSNIKRILFGCGPNRCQSASISTSKSLLDDGRRLSGNTHRANNFEKRLLVWAGKYKKIEDIPAFVAPESVEKARSRMRIRVANIMIVLTLVGCVAMVYSGKAAHARGESLQRRNLESHRRYNEEADAKEKAQQQKQ